MSRRVLIIGIDGGTWTVLEPAIAGGYMPTLGRLCREGARGNLHSTIPAITPAAWSTFQTGCNPGAHGVLDFSWLDRNTRKLNFVSSRNLRDTLWNRLSRSGYRIGVINVPMTYPPQPVNGYILSGILTPSLQSEFTYPGPLKQELLKAIPDYHIFNLDNIGTLYRSGPLNTAFIDQMVHIAGLRVQAADFLLQKEPLDVLMVHFQASDVIQHALWHWLDPDHPRFDPDRQRELFGRFYRRLDGYISDIIRLFRHRAGDDFLTVLLSDHGFQTHRHRFNLGVWLFEQGYLSLRRKDLSARKLKRITKTLRIGKILGSFLSKQKMQDLEQKVVASVPAVTWEKSRAFATGRSGEGYIYLLEEGPARRETARALMDGLLTVRHPDTGDQVIRQVWPKESLYSGRAMEMIPDLIIEPADGYSCTSACRPEQGLFISVADGDDFHQGKHHRDGIYVLQGPQVRPMQQPADLIDLPHTILSFLGANTDSMEGTVRKEWFTIADDQWIQRKSTRSYAEEKDRPAEQTYSSEDEQQIQKRLEDLGYL